MTGETQPRRRKDKKKSRKDSVSDVSGDEEVKEHFEQGSSCLTVLVFIILLGGIGLLAGLIYVQSSGIAHVATPKPSVEPAAPLVQTVIETVVQEGIQELGQPPSDSEQEEAAAKQQAEPATEEAVVESETAPDDTTDVDSKDTPDAAEEPAAPEVPPVAAADAADDTEEAEAVVEEQLAELPDEAPEEAVEAVEHETEEQVSPEYHAEEPAPQEHEAEEAAPLEHEAEEAAQQAHEAEEAAPQEHEAEEAAPLEHEAEEAAPLEHEAEEAQEHADAQEPAEVYSEGVVDEHVPEDYQGDHGPEEPAAGEHEHYAEEQEAPLEEEHHQEHAEHDHQEHPAHQQGHQQEAQTEQQEPEQEVYEHADITGAEDWPVRDQLDKAEALLDKDRVAALNAFGAILAKHPRSPRAMFGRARALNAQAMEERSNNVLDKSISALKSVLQLDVEYPVPLALFRTVAETAVQQMRFRGLADQAARIQQRLIQKFPYDYTLRNHLATVFMTYGQNSAAQEVLQEVLRLWPNNGYAKVHLGFLRRLAGEHAEAARLMQAGLDSDEPGVHAGRFYYSLGDSYYRIGEHENSKQVYEEGAQRGLYPSALQRSLYNVDRLTGRPFWTAEQTGSQQLISELEQSWQAIRDEMQTQLLDSDRPEDGFQVESEDLSRAGDWKQYSMYRRGRRDQYACTKLPVTCGLVQKYPEAAGNRRGQVKFSMLAPGTRVWPHSGPTNCRLRLHLGLVVPPNTGIKAAGETRSWEEGKVLVLDDSFEHEVWNNGSDSRFILIVDIWHPELTPEERKTLPSI